MDLQKLITKIEQLEVKVDSLTTEVNQLKQEKVENMTLFKKLKSMYSYSCPDCDDQPFKTRNSWR